MKIRPLQLPADRADVESLISEIQALGEHPLVGERTLLELEIAQASGFLAVEGRRAIGAALIVDDSGHWTLDVAASDQTVTGALVDRVAAGAREEQTTVRWWVYEGRVAPPGWRAARELNHVRLALEGGLDVPLPSGVRLATFRRGQDENSWLEAQRRTFEHHPERDTWDHRRLAWTMRRPWFDPGGFFLAWDGDAVAGFCWTKRHSVELGEIYFIGVDPSQRRRGLGRALLAAGLSDLAIRQGCRQAGLYVESDNPSAAALYDKMGFRLHHTDRLFVLRE